MNRVRPHFGRSAPVLLLAGLLAAGCITGPPDEPPAGPESPPGGRPGAAGSGDPLLPDAGNGGYDALHYDLRLTYDPARRAGLSASARITARATQDLSRFHLDLAGLEVDRVAVDGREAAHRRHGTELEITPRRVLPEGREFEVAVRYHGEPRPVGGSVDDSEDGWLTTDDGALVMGEPLGAMTWYPVNNTVRDPATYAVSLTVPDGLTGVSVGRYEGRDASPAADGHDTFRWRTEAATLPYLVTVAVGRFELRRSETPSGVEVVTAVDPREAEDARQVLADIPGFVAWGEELFGPYPYATAGAIVDHQPDIHVALETLGRPVYGTTPSGMIMAHEYAHQWVGNSVRIADWRQIWLNEGLATYAMWLWDGEHGGRSPQEWHDLYLDTPEDHPVWSFPPAAPSEPGELFDPPVYYRGAMALHELRQRIGDEDFFALLKRWVAERAGKPSTVAQFEALAERVSGEDLDRLFDVWLHGEGKPPAR